MLRRSRSSLSDCRHWSTTVTIFEQNRLKGNVIGRMNAIPCHSGRVRVTHFVVGDEHRRQRHKEAFCRKVRAHSSRMGNEQNLRLQSCFVYNGAVLRICASYSDTRQKACMQKRRDHETGSWQRNKKHEAAVTNRRYIMLRWWRYILPKVRFSYHYADEIELRCAVNSREQKYYAKESKQCCQLSTTAFFNPMSGRVNNAINYRQ